MRHPMAAFLGVGLLLLAGCTVPWLRPQPPANGGINVPTANPTAADLVTSLNTNAQRLQSVTCRESMEMTIAQGFQTYTVSGSMVAQKPRNFRLSGKFLKNTIADIGSNDREFWFWSSKSPEPYLFHCSHEDFARSQGRIQLPFQPDWIMEALGMAEYDPRKPYQLVAKGNSLQLVEQTVSPQGEPVRKITVLTRGANQQYIVTAHLLLDKRGKEIASAQVIEAQRDRATDAVIPKKVKLKWPDEKLEVTMTLNEVLVNNPLPPEQVARLFTRPNLKDVQSVDLARGRDAPAPGGPIRRAGGFVR